MPPLHLIADDLTGALDSAVAFATAATPIAVRWTGVPADARTGQSLALDSGTREVAGGADAARHRVADLAAALPADPAALRFAKLDSLLRGHGAAEIAAWMAVDRPDHCIIAPAFPFQGRVTRGGRQRLRVGDGWEATRTDLAADLAAMGETVRLCRPGDPIPPGVSLWDAESDADLAGVAAAGLALTGLALTGRVLTGRVLWCGSGGLALALAGALRGVSDPVAPPALPRPWLGLFGTDHPVTQRQLAACGAAVVTVPDGGAEAAARVRKRMDGLGAALVRLDLPPGLARDAAAARIDRELGALARRLPPPGTLLVSGGETLRGLCRALEADHLALDGALLPGAPTSTLRGGRWDGVRVLSKSGAFGTPDLLRRLLDADPSAPA